MAVFHSGQIIAGKYRVVQQIGKGGMGAVYAVENTATGSRGALKVLTLDVHAHPDLFVRFQNEARAANQAGHPGVVPVYDSGQLEDGTPWLVMPFLDGEPLNVRMRRAQSTPERVMGMDSLWIIGDIASALAAAHERGVIHRDLKPGNVVLVSDPSTRTGERAMVLDFGVAKLCDDELTKKGSVLGTPVYMALEQFRDSATVDGKADVFSLGCISYQMLSGRLPHPGMTPFDIMGQRMMDPVPPLADIAPSVPTEVAAWVMTMLEKEPEDRPTMAAVEAEVRKSLGLATPRQTGRIASIFSQQVTVNAGSAPLNVPGSTEKEATRDVLSEALTASGNAGPSSALVLGTPSEQRAVGEISPPSAVRIPPNVPQSLSHIATAPVPVPLVQAGPHAQTLGPAPLMVPPAHLAPPSAPTQSALPGPPRSHSFYVAGGMLTLTVCLSAFLVLKRWPGPPKVQIRPASASAPPLTPQPTDAPAQAPAPPQKTELPTPATPVALHATSEPSEPSERSEQGPRHKESSPKRRCESIAAKCVSGFAMTKAQQQEIAESFQEAKVKLCGSDQVSFTWKAGQLRIQSAPAAFGPDAQSMFKLLLRNNLQSPSLPGLITVRCTQH
jgi:serine/threonine protein kinase